MLDGKIVLVTGGFDPLHSGHLHYIKAAKHLTDRSNTVLIVAILACKDAHLANNNLFKPS